MQITDFPDMPAMLRDAVMRALEEQYDGRLFEADQLYQQIVRRRPLHPLLANTAAGFFLQKGNFAAAWPLFEQRLSLHYYTHRPFAKMAQPMWTGEDIGKGRLLIFCDMGLGDTILMARFLPWVLARVGSLAMQVNPGTAAFWQARFPDTAISELGDPLPECDFRLNMFCLPRLYGADQSNMPGPPYLAADDGERSYWRERLNGGGEFKIGVTWQGNPDHVRDFERSIPVSALSPLIADDRLRSLGARFYSVQLHEGGAEGAALAAAEGLTDLGPEMMARDPLEASAALIAELDLVIAVDSAFANLAAAMDRPFWLPTYKVPDWRWQIYPTLDADRPEVAPWYGAQRVFSCTERALWEPVVETMRMELRDRLGAG